MMSRRRSELSRIVCVNAAGVRVTDLVANPFHVTILILEMIFGTDPW
jgi:hypothetical protein